MFCGKLLSCERMQLHFPWCHCPTERGLLLLFPLAKPVIAWKQAYEMLSHGTFVLKIAREILMDGFSSADLRMIFSEKRVRSGSQSKKKIRLFALSLYRCTCRFMLNPASTPRATSPIRTEFYHY